MVFCAGTIVIDKCQSVFFLSFFLMHANQWIEIYNLKFTVLATFQTYFSQFCFNMRPTSCYVQCYDGQYVYFKPIKCLMSAHVGMWWWTSDNLYFMLFYCMKAVIPSSGHDSHILHIPGDVSVMKVKMVMAS